MRGYSKAKGTRTTDRQKMISVRFENEIFTRLSDEADARGMSFAELIRFYVGKGIDATNAEPC